MERASWAERASAIAVGPKRGGYLSGSHVVEKARDVHPARHGQRLLLAVLAVERRRLLLLPHPRASRQREARGQAVFQERRRPHLEKSVVAELETREDELAPIRPLLLVVARRWRTNVEVCGWWCAAKVKVNVTVEVKVKVKVKVVVRVVA